MKVHLRKGTRTLIVRLKPYNNYPKQICVYTTKREILFGHVTIPYPTAILEENEIVVDLGISWKSELLHQGILSDTGRRIESTIAVWRINLEKFSDRPTFAEPLYFEDLEEIDRRVARVEFRLTISTNSTTIKKNKLELEWLMSEKDKLKGEKS